jgi:hypothetical protein
MRPPLEILVKFFSESSTGLTAEVLPFRRESVNQLGHITR